MNNELCPPIEPKDIGRLYGQGDLFPKIWARRRLLSETTIPVTWKDICSFSRTAASYDGDKMRHNLCYMSTHGVFFYAYRGVYSKVTLDLCERDICRHTIEDEDFRGEWEGFSENSARIYLFVSCSGNYVMFHFQDGWKATANTYSCRYWQWLNPNEWEQPQWQVPHYFGVFDGKASVAAQKPTMTARYESIYLEKDWLENFRKNRHGRWEFNNDGIPDYKTPCWTRIVRQFGELVFFKVFTSKQKIFDYYRKYEEGYAIEDKEGIIFWTKGVN
jgi:hypothetical protein